MSWLSNARLPRSHDPARASVAWTRWREKAAVPDDPTFTALLDALFGNSPYLTEAALQNTELLTDLWRDGPDAALVGLERDIATARSDAAAGATPDVIAARLRRLKRSVAL